MFEQRTIIAIIGIPLLIVAFGILAYYQVISLNDLSAILVTVIISSIVGLVVWGFKPKEKIDYHELAEKVHVEEQARLKAQDEHRSATFGTPNPHYDETNE